MDLLKKTLSYVFLAIKIGCGKVFNLLILFVPTH